MPVECPQDIVRLFEVLRLANSRLALLIFANSRPALFSYARVSITSPVVRSLILRARSDTSIGPGNTKL